MTDIEIPYVKDRHWRYRLFEILPGFFSWFMLALPFILSLVSPILCVIFVLVYLLIWFFKAMGLNVRSIQGYRRVGQHEKLPWGRLVDEIDSGTAVSHDKTIPEWHYENIARLQATPAAVKPRDVYHALIIATYNEAREVLEPTVKSVLASDYDMKKVILVLAYEQRGGPTVAANAKALMDEYRHHFHAAFAVEHPADIPGEVIGKGGNITYAGRELEKYLVKEGIKPLNVIVTTLDADNRPHPLYLSGLTYLYCVCPDPRYISFQPIPMFTNNIWDAPAPMRVIATGNSFWNVVLSMRPHMLRNFSSHAQSMQTLLDTDYWSVRTIVEDGHQFWRTYFAYDGKHAVYPVYLPIYQDAVLSNTLRKTLKAQFIQLRRWAWGASDIAYVAEVGFFRRNNVPKWDLFMKFCRLVEGHITWAVAPLILLFSSRIPALLNRHYVSDSAFLVIKLPVIASRIQTVAVVGIFITLFLSFKMLPPKPARYKHRRTVWMLLQWALLPITTIVYNSLAALYSQTRLMFGRYLGTFDVTDKAVITEDKQKIL